MANSDTIVTGNGIIIVESMMANSTPAALEADAGEAIGHHGRLEIVVPRTLSTAMISVLRVRQREVELRML